MPTQCPSPQPATRPAKAPHPTLVRGEQLAVALNVSLATVYYLVAKGILPRPRKLGSRALWLSTDIEETLKALPYKRSRKAQPIPDLPFTTGKAQPKRKAAARTDTGGNRNANSQ